jgi:hypothetical protein
VCLNGLATLTVTASGGTGGLQFSLNGGAYQSSNLFVGITNGTYTCKVKDAGGCIKTSTSVVVNCAAVVCPAISVKATAGLILCNGGTTSLTVAASGGVGPYTYSINGGAYVSSNVFASLTAGAYICKVKDSKGCIGTAVSLTIAQPAALNISVSAGVCLNGLATLTVTASGGTGGLQFSLNGGAYQSSNLFVGLTNGTYTCKVKDAGGCIKTSTSVVVNCIGLFSPVDNTNELSTTLQASRSTIDTDLQMGREKINSQSPSFSIKASPNPYRDRVKFVMQSNVNGKASLILYNTTGVKVAEVYNGFINAKTPKTIDFLIPDKSRGNLFYILSIGNHKESGKLINLK